MEKITVAEQANSAALMALIEQEREITYWCTRQAEAILYTGKALKAIKDGELYKEKGYKSFADYMDGNAFDGLKIKATQAYKYVSVYEKYGDRLFDLNCNNLEVLYILRDIPMDELDGLVESERIGKMTKSEAEELKKKLDEANEQISLLAAEKEQDTDTIKAEQEAAEEARKKAEAADERISELERLLKESESKPIEAVMQPDEKTIKKIKSDAEKSAKKAAKAEIEKERAKAEAAVAEAERIKQEQNNMISEKASADERIKELERKLQSAEKPADEQLIEFKFYFQETQENLKKFIGVIDKVSDQEQKEKFRGAAKKFVQGILVELGE